jgi:CRISPR-associated Cas5-like protein
VGLDREDLAVDAERTNAVFRAEIEGSHQGFGIPATQFRQPSQPLPFRQTQHRCDRGRSELDWFPGKLAAQPKPKLRR